MVLFKGLMQNVFRVTDWVAKQADREREEARKRTERLERRRADPRHVFDDKGYTENIRQNAERIGEALQHGKLFSSLLTVVPSYYSCLI